MPSANYSAYCFVKLNPHPHAVTVLNIFCTFTLSYVLTSQHITDHLKPREREMGRIDEE
jgi:hypothetical protein